ncbi:MAG: 5-methyltetrahydropteroyltriglutamate--homocysteine methyltransferase [Acidimicrobiia bacterium]|jgi:5-methyltetrahydropteroyltriglutamate--homocysteine methyltransferase|nr:5-methyltetrahydropteroyltriglutamate--homocysteine methyltransferase [Acidimicrobiia bacterium]
MEHDPPFRAEHVGSLLRPRSLKEAAKELAAGTTSPEAYAEALDKAVAEAVALQEDVGLGVVTDGEFGRSSWFGFFFERLEGFSIAPSQYRFRDHTGQTYEWSTCFSSGRLGRPRGIATDEFDRLRKMTSRTPKANLPSPSVLHFFRGDDCRDPAVYPDLDQWWADVVAVYRAEVADLAAHGCRYLQLDEVPVAMLCDPAVQAQVRAGGADPEALLEGYLQRVDELLDGRPDGMTIGMHLCRGNFRSRWMASGGYEPVAERLFNQRGIDAFFLEYDSERAGDFSPLRHVPPDKVVVLGLVSTKTDALEDEDRLRRRIDEAARYVSLDQLALSPQCGFASVAGGNTLDEETQRRKLGLVVKVASEVWAV